MSMHLLLVREGAVTPAPCSTDDVLFELIRIVRGAHAWCADVLPHEPADACALAAHLRDAAAALVPVTPGPGATHPSVVDRALHECADALERARLALVELHGAPATTPIRWRRPRRARARAAERAVAFAVLRVAVDRARQLTTAAIERLDVSSGDAGGLPSTPNPRSVR